MTQGCLFAACFATTELVVRWPLLREMVGLDAPGAALAPAETFS